MQLEVISREPKEKRFEAPLLFVHGTGHGAWCWDEYFLPYFAESGFSAHAVSLRGHGASEGFEKLKWTSIADYIADVFQVVSDLPQRPVVIGHSMGGLVVQKYLEKHAAPAAILVAPSPSEGMFWTGLKIQLRNPWLMAKIFFRQDYSVMFATPQLAKKFLLSAGTDDAKVTEYVSRFGKESYRANLEMIYNLPKPQMINVPMLVLGAQNDAILPPLKIEKTARDFKADVKIFPDMAHDLMLERGWQKVADFMIDWLKNLSDRRRDSAANTL
jgi:pimeloyl-ACP methyl ester carboxylesterase